ncbi:MULTISPECIES: ABC transporter ATP-binding protein [unclassified Bacillus (in: firmicutes)]|uniref:ABC transporter ATP-binding protein n=1 Tax=unclassified Bacillus (in: firmicutes) TaxID=185979 RepID=UPI0008EA43A1|nr:MULTISPECIES: ABC transporter ATP-binding protein [unclassified Bacillus (in: firmicutes)]SFB09311.1 peptide/nickel transport system ATP-binding protein [Bacillus sp. UNCCL13]SFQ86766.1 peptide/nickel transport system ATP-binding protein [Bacillus sp. cl95]
MVDNIKDKSNLLEVKDLRTSFYDGNSKMEAVRGIDFTVQKGEILGIVGESGSGKSVMVKSILGIIPAHAKVDAGEIILDGKRIDALSPKQKRSIRGREIAMIFQDPMTALNPLKKAGDHLVDLLIRVRGMKKKEAKLEAIELLKMVGIPSPEKRVDQYPHEFSGGMRQRVLIAMALACNPKLLIADEPTTALDVTIQAQILELLNKLQNEKDMSVVLITHDLGVVATICSRILVMYAGMVMEEGLTHEIFYSPKHPYTKALLNSIPRVDGEKTRLKPIKGSAPSLKGTAQGCPFAERCEFAFDKCLNEVPEYHHFSSTQRSMCFLTEKGEEINE